MNVETGTEPPQFLFWENVFRIFGIVSLQSTPVPISQLLTLWTVLGGLQQPQELTGWNAGSGLPNHCGLA